MCESTNDSIERVFPDIRDSFPSEEYLFRGWETMDSEMYYKKYRVTYEDMQCVHSGRAVLSY